MSRVLKDSGIKWIGNIPENRAISKVQYLFFRRREVNTDLDPIVLSLARDGVKERDITTNEGQLAASYIGYHKVYKNDLMINPMDLYSGANCSLSEIEGVISPAYINLASKGNCYPKYYDYFFKNQYWSRAMFIHGKGVSFDNRRTINAETMAKYYLPVPPLQEQQKIADYLDKKCSKIDEQKANYEKSIELLKEYKQSFIDKIINLNDGKYVRIKNICYVKGRIGWQGLKADEFIDEGPYLVTGTDFQNGGVNRDTCYHISMERYEEAKEIQLQEKDLLVTKDGTVGKLAYIDKLPGLTSLNSHLFVVRPLNLNQYDNKYLYRVLQTTNFQKYFHLESSGSIMESLTQETFLNYKLKIPGISEQKQIADYLDKECGKIDKVIAYREQMIEKLDEYKKSLIYECVTGKKEIK